MTLDFDAKTIDEQSNQEILPPQYRESCFDIVTESIISDTSIFITEKTWKPILYKTPFLPLGSKKMCKHLEEFFGIKPYHNMFNYSFDYFIYIVVNIFCCSFNPNFKISYYLIIS